MSFSDWLTISLALAGCIIAIAISLYFFRAQQQTDFNKLQARIGEVLEGIANLTSQDNVKEQVGFGEKLILIQSSIELLNKDVSNLSTKILADVRGEQGELLRSVQEKFEQQIEKSRQALENSLQRELIHLIPLSSQPEALSNITELVKHVLLSMGEFQRLTFQTHSEETLSNLEAKVSGDIVGLSNDVRGLQKQMENLTLTLHA
jgi:hypothetical protein